MILLTRVESEKNMNRWYSISVQPTLLDPLAVIYAWGNRRTNYQRVRVLPVESQKAAAGIVEDLVARKVRRGYQVA